MCSTPFAAARLNRETRWPGPGLVPAFQRRTLRALIFSRRASSRQGQPGSLPEAVQPLREVLGELLRLDVVDPLLRASPYSLTVRE